MARESPRWSFHCFAEPAPWLDPAEIEDARRRNPGERFNRLWHGVWSTGTGNAISAADVLACCTAPGPHPCRLSELYVAGVDLARKRDRAALVVLGVDRAKWGESGRDADDEAIPPRVSLARVKAWNPADYPGGTIPLDSIRREILNVHRQLGLHGVVFDTWQAALMTEQLTAEGLWCLDFNFTPANMDHAARDLLDAFQNRWLRLYRDEPLIQDIHALNLVERPTGFRLDAKRTAAGHADRAFALSIALPFALRWSRELTDAAEPFEEWLTA